MLREASRAGVAATSATRPTSTFGRGRVAGRLGAGGGPRMRRVVIKSRFVHLRKVGSRAISSHLRYLQRDGVTRSGARGEAYGAHEEEVDLAAFETRSQGDRHQFRFIVSVEDAAALEDLRPYTRALMERVAIDLEMRLDWIAVDHWDTDNPHTHVVLRGRTPDGRDLVIAPDYMANGMRARAMGLATEWLGPRTELEIREARLREVDQERFTSLDRLLVQRAHCRVVDFGVVDEGKAVEPLLRGRLQRLESLGLASRAGPHRWVLSPSLQPALTSLGERGDILRTLRRTFGNAMRDHVIEEAGRPAPLVGRIAAKGLADELSDRGYLVIDGVDGRGHYLPLPAGKDLEAFPIGGILEVRIHDGARAADANIARLAREGVYRPDEHLEHLRTRGTVDADARDVVEGHVRRLEALRRAGIVARVDEGRWQVPPDLTQQGARYDQRKGNRIEFDLVSHFPLAQQIEAIGATWLDRHLIEGTTTNIGRSGFGHEVHEALRVRTAFLVEQGVADRMGSHVVVHRNLIDTLTRRELDATAKAIAAETQLERRPFAEGASVTGVYRRVVLLMSGRFAMLDDGLGFSLVPWRPVIETRLGQSMTATLHGGRVSWHFGRTRGPSIGSS
jgi:type IV secretory pathway VirD2 relaxase